ncbi:Stn1p LALA0_S07e01068g [Lachancea lanzarotensis]|uniref:LALA0S07e01068g1_1 n=1 Tax=Lachancea lanzarotensis TaxID=1245769 RepID=A0A0C7N971_9SACH|nr:uncharacterized protein LALA0_S07e01068g [Lachancea lanzarotensis]CEP63040.1 LALA0S07e01068g1_1 [Lachancea lanzarotensis]
MPRWDHIAYQTEGVDYYIPVLFRYSATFEQKVPCFVGDLTRGLEKWEKEIQRYYPNGSAFWLLGNHPIRKLTVQGYVVSWKWKFIGEIDYALFKIDDCTREAADIASLLPCKCSKSLILQNGLPNINLSGCQLKMHGSMNKYRELDVESIEVCTGVLKEVGFWRMAMQWREVLAEPWVIDEKALNEAFLSQDEGLGPNTTYNFVHWLEREAYKSEMQISGEDRPSGTTQELLLPMDLDYVNSVVADGNWCGNEVVVESANDRDSSPVEARQLADPVVELVSQKSDFSLSDYRRLLTEYLICQRKNEISMLNTFRNPTLMQVLRSLLRGKCEISRKEEEEQQQEDEEASRVFAQAVARLADMGVARVLAQGRILNLQMLQFCYTQASARIAVLVAMRLNTGVLDFEALCNSVNLLYQKPLNGILLDIYKRALRCATENPNSLVRSWWIEMSSSSTAVVHFVRVA